jgi:Concanavalin A-like lectin/glucanases superfamily
MPTPSAKRGLPQIAGSDSPDVPRDINALIAALEAEVGYLGVRDVLDVGVLGQTRAGRVLTLADFTDLGLSAPLGLWNLAGLTDVSGNGRNLSNKGAVPFGKGITGAAAEAAVFAGSTGQALYIVDTGASDPFRIVGGSFGYWAKTSKRGTDQRVLSKYKTALHAYYSGIDASNVASAVIDTSGTLTGGQYVSLLGTSDIADDRWHFVVTTYDGTIARLYVDGILEASAPLRGFIAQVASPFNIGGVAADAGVSTGNPHFGRVQTAFVTSDVLSEDQIRCLMAVKLPHGAPRPPRRAGLAVRRRRRGGLLTVADFPSEPRRLYNLHRPSVGGYLDDITSNNVNLDPTSGLETATPGPDGGLEGAVSLNGTSHFLFATDTGLPAGTDPSTMGIWFKTNGRATTDLAALTYGWGGARRLFVERNDSGANAGRLATWDGTSVVYGPRVDDGQWHNVAVVYENIAADGLKVKLYLDGRLVASATTFATTALRGAGGLQIGAGWSGAAVNQWFAGSLARAFVTDYALTPDQIIALYAKGSQDLGLSPKNPGDHVERIDATNVLLLGDTLDPQDRVELEVAA